MFQFRVRRLALNQEELEQQIDRCRRIASVMTDDEVRHSLEQLATEYEAQLLPRRRSFMLSSKAQEQLVIAAGDDSKGD